MMKIDKILFKFVLICILASCKKQNLDSVLDLFTESEKLVQKAENKISEDSLAIVEGITCDDKYLIIYDLHSGESYTLFDKNTGAYLARFGTIGQGPAEIPAGCYGYLSNNNFSVFNDQIRSVMKYELDSLRNGVEKNPVRLAKYDIADARLSRLIAIDDSTFLGAGSYKSRYQYLLFGPKSNVIDYGVDIYNATDDKFDMYTKYLSNQGDLVMRPDGKVFAYSLNFSSNLDIVEVKNGKINLVKSLRLGNPIYKPTTTGEYCFADITEETLLGYINLSATTKYIYALYSDEPIYKAGRRMSDIVLVFDWNGNAVKKYILDTKAYYITIDEVGRTMFTAVKNEEGGWRIASYPL